MGWVRVVWLGVFSVRVLAGAGSHGLVMQAQRVMGWWVVWGWAWNGRGKAGAINGGWVEVAGKEQFGVLVPFG